MYDIILILISSSLQSSPGLQKRLISSLFTSSAILSPVSLLKTGMVNNPPPPPLPPASPSPPFPPELIKPSESTGRIFHTDKIYVRRNSLNFVLISVCCEHQIPFSYKIFESFFPQNCSGIHQLFSV